MSERHLKGSTKTNSAWPTAFRFQLAIFSSFVEKGRAFRHSNARLREIFAGTMRQHPAPIGKFQTGRIAQRHFSFVGAGVS